jgi:hypothetical protein
MITESTPSGVRYQLAPHSGPVTLHHTAGTATGSATTFTDRGGLIFPNIHLQLIFWGKTWAGEHTPPTAQDVQDAVESIIIGQYLSALSQYRNIGTALVAGTTLVTSSDPPNPFSDDDVADFISGLIHAKTVPEPQTSQQLLYCVFIPVGVHFNQPNIIGEHSFFIDFNYTFPFDVDLGPVYYAWVTNDGTLDSVTTIFSHELVESCTNPDGNGIQGAAGVCTGDGWCEIGDVCQGNNGVLNGVLVQSYWSQRDGVCIVPSA